MFSLFKTKSESEKLQKKYESLMKEWHALMNVNRKESDKKFAEAQQILDKMDRTNPN
ncbi:MAG: Lacal_2735 family protein [Flavobacteriales bacterium]|nr:Lacal_2735 family protein [Flavobacteriia bacterium]NCP05253.1 Lacal_2735 family protein [Flavobacteriales bacterium]NCP52641.1 Lacal_2735 family protein [Flavobacteriales bacterium]NCP59433.1 Lacal_2735 family protein [Flavobacteriales bacterium]NCP90191.1 Lacal_2735 family protein [Flavobacteriales bacterium]